jgi:hypothetical protein
MAILSHKIPIAYLKRFADKPKKGKVWVYEEGRPPRIGSPKSESAERGFFATKLPDGSIDDFQGESWAQKIEDAALDILINAPSPVFVWTPTNRRKMAEYWALLFQRTTSFYTFHKDRAKEIFEKQRERIDDDPILRERLVQRYSQLSRRPLTEEEALTALDKGIATLLRDAELRHHYVERLEHRVGLFSGVLIEKPWQIWRAPQDSQFVTSDSPVMTFVSDQWKRYTVGHGLAKDGVIVLLPLCPSACLAAGVSGPHEKTISIEDVTEVNKMVICGASRFAYSQSNEQKIDQLVQNFLGVIKFGRNAFVGSDDEFKDLFL